MRLRRRVNRFAVEVEASGRTLRLHLPNSGRMRELLPPGTLGLAHLAAGAGRRTDGTLLLVWHEGRWVSVDARMPNRLLASALERGSLPPFRQYQSWQEEAPWGKGRVDFLLRSKAGLCLVEAKSCNLVVDGVALFPDAPTARGTRHLAELEQGIRAGHRAVVVWFVQRSDACYLAPHRQADPAFAAALERAVAAGVEAFAYRCRVTPQAVTVLDAIPVRLTPSPCVHETVAAHVQPRPNDARGRS